MDNEHILQFFAYNHLPEHLREVSKPFSELSVEIMKLPRNPERTVALRKLLEAKDAAVRARLADDRERDRVIPANPGPDGRVTVKG